MRELSYGERSGVIGVYSSVYFLLMCILVFILSVPVSATVLSFDISFIYEGPGVPTNPPPWLNITFDDGGTAGTVDLTISAPGLTGHEKVAELYLNLDPTLDPTQLVFSDPPGKTGNFTTPEISLGFDSFQANGDGLYDVLFAFDADGWKRAFNGGDIVQYSIALASLTANSFDFISASGPGAIGGYQTAAHLISLGAAEDSAWVTTPEPATIMLLGLGGLALLRKRRA